MPGVGLALGCVGLGLGCVGFGCAGRGLGFTFGRGRVTVQTDAADAESCPQS